MQTMIQLEKFVKKDYEQLICWVDSAETLMQFAGPVFVFPLTAEQLDKSLSDTNRQAFKVVDSRGHQTIGHAEIYLTDTAAYLGRILVGDKALRGKGLGQQIVHLLVAHIFSTTDKKIIELNVFDWNIGAIRCYEKAGFTIDPGKKHERKINGQTWIALNMIIEKQKWELQKK
jgi:RimJ/RimL family protein N-acetyltransferase